MARELEGSIFSILSAPFRIRRTVERGTPVVCEREWKLVAIDLETGQYREIGDLPVPSSAIVTGFSLHPNGKSFICYR